MKKSRLKFRVVLIVAVAFIIWLGMFREQIVDFLALKLTHLTENDSFTTLSGFIDFYGSSKTAALWIANYIIFYPTYLGCHFILIHILFRDFTRLRRRINFGLLLLLVILISGKLIFGILNVTVLAEYFSFAFHKLIGLPFLLLAIEGGSYFYKLIFIEKDL